MKISTETVLEVQNEVPRDGPRKVRFGKILWLLCMLFGFILFSAGIWGYVNRLKLDNEGQEVNYEFDPSYQEDLDADLTHFEEINRTRRDRSDGGV